MKKCKDGHVLCFSLRFTLKPPYALKIHFLVLQLSLHKSAPAAMQTIEGGQRYDDVSHQRCLTHTARVLQKRPEQSRNVHVSGIPQIQGITHDGSSSCRVQPCDSFTF